VPADNDNRQKEALAVAVAGTSILAEDATKVFLTEAPSPFELSVIEAAGG